MRARWWPNWSAPKSSWSRWRVLRRRCCTSGSPRGSAGVRLEAHHPVDIRAVAEERLHAAQVAELLLAHIGHEHQVAHRRHVQLVEHLDPRQEDGQAARIVSDAGCEPLAFAKPDRDVNRCESSPKAFRKTTDLSIPIGADVQRR